MLAGLLLHINVRNEPGYPHCWDKNLAISFFVNKIITGNNSRDLRMLIFYFNCLILKTLK